MKKKLVLKREVKERLDDDLFDLSCIIAGLLFVFLFILVF